jgi:hypothetical protein
MEVEKLNLGINEKNRELLSLKQRSFEEKTSALVCIHII